MSTDKLFIPTKCKVGYNPRPDTYSGKLGYIIMNDGKTWRKEHSWKGWIYDVISEEEFEVKKLAEWECRIDSGRAYYQRHVDNGDFKDLTLEAYYSKIGLNNYATFEPRLGKIISDQSFIPKEFDNLPTEGFVLNKKVGGNKYSWNPRDTYARVYDPRGWEFEISIPNLLFILECCDCMKGKGLSGEFVYSWDGKDLVLLPCNSENYQSSIEHTQLQSKSVKAKELVVGYTYRFANGNDAIYLGKLPKVVSVKDGKEEYIHTDYWNHKSKRTRTKYKNVIKKFFAFKDNSYSGYTNYTSISSVKSLVSDVIPENFAELLDTYYTKHKTKLENE
jgi:hypothetical protein